MKAQLKSTQADCRNASLWPVMPSNDPGQVSEISLQAPLLRLETSWPETAAEVAPGVLLGWRAGLTRKTRHGRYDNTPHTNSSKNVHLGPSNGPLDCFASLTTTALAPILMSSPLSAVTDSSEAPDEKRQLAQR